MGELQAGQAPGCWGSPMLIWSMSIGLRHVVYCRHSIKRYRQLHRVNIRCGRAGGTGSAQCITGGAQCLKKLSAAFVTQLRTHEIARRAEVIHRTNLNFRFRPAVTLPHGYYTAHHDCRLWRWQCEWCTNSSQYLMVSAST